LLLWLDGRTESVEAHASAKRVVVPRLARNALTEDLFHARWRGDGDVHRSFLGMTLSERILEARERLKLPPDMEVFERVVFDLAETREDGVLVFREVPQ
jgi:hypothetical protein